MPIFVGNRFQRGHGLGNILGGLARMVVPILKQTGKAVLKEGIRAGSNILNDVGTGQNFKQSIKRRFKQSGVKLVKKAASALERGDPSFDVTPAQPPHKKRRRINKKVVKKASQLRSKPRDRRSRNNDIFNS